jgi:glutamate-1-semialdehyde 2,1-aminomutase
MSAINWQDVHYTESDRVIWEEDLEAFVPQRIFDAHIHLWNPEALAPDSPHHASRFAADMTLTEEWNRRMFPGRTFDYLVLGMPTPGIDVASHNAFMARELASHPNSRANRLVTPQCRPEDIAADIRKLGFMGLKPYRIYSVTGDTHRCRIHEFLTHPQLEVANELGLWVTMHLSRWHGCADAENLRDLEEYTTRRYPRIKWILAHCARSFTYWAIREAVDRLRDLPNIWYDNSAVSDVMAHYTLFKKEDHRRIFYGSDNLIANSFHGRYVPLGRFWYQMETPEYAKQANIHTDARPVLAIYDQLLAMKHAAELSGLSRAQIEDVFYHNAARAFGLPAT